MERNFYYSLENNNIMGAKFHYTAREQQQIGTTRI
jgi:hypothetical protein